MVPDPRKALVERLLDRLYPVTPNGRTGFAWKEYDATKAELLALLATDPTTLRTALDALRYLSDAATNILNTKAADPLFPVRVVDLSRANADAQDVIIAALATPAPAADYPGPKPFPPGCICGTDNLTDDCTAHPAPAADEARCGFMWSVDGRACGRPEDDERHTEDAFLFHPFQPAPTPAPPTPPATEEGPAVVVAHWGGDPDSCSLHGDIPRDVSPAEHVRELHAAEIDAWERVSIDGHPGWAEPTPPATEERVTHGRHCRCTPCCREDWTNPNLAHCGVHGPSCPPVYAPIDLTPPATETVDPTRPHKCWCQHGYAAESEGIPPLTTPPATGTVAALVDLRSRFVRDLQDDNMGLFDGEMPVRLDAIVAAARAEVDVEALALALHDAHIECRFWYVDGARTESEFHHDHATRIIAALARRAGEGTVTDLDPRWAFCLTSCGCDGRSLAIECSGDFPASHGGRCKRCTR